MGTAGRLREPGGELEGRWGKDYRAACQIERLLFLDDIRSLYFSSYFIKIHMHKICHLMLPEWLKATLFIQEAVYSSPACLWAHSSNEDKLGLCTVS